MKFFTQAWWEAGCDNAGEVFRQYEAYLSGVREHLPPTLLELETQHTLHDAELKSLEVSGTEQTVLLVLNGWNRELQYRVRYTLRFTGVSRLAQQLPAEDFVEQELGDLGYWECEWLQPEVEVRMLFVSSATLTIRFTGFSFEHARR